MPRLGLVDRIGDKFTIGDGCWEWDGAVDGGGYGQLIIDRQTWKAHRLVYEWLVAPIPAGLELDHLCRNRCCVRPDHLEPVSHAENVRRGHAGRHHAVKTHCPQGHPYDEANTYVRPDRPNRRDCRTCRRAATARSRGKEASLGVE